MTTTVPAGVTGSRALRPRARTGTAMALTSMIFVQLGMAASVGMVDEVGAQGVVWLRLGWAGVLVLLVVRPRPSNAPRCRWRSWN